MCGHHILGINHMPAKIFSALFTSSIDPTILRKWRCSLGTCSLKTFNLVLLPILKYQLVLFLESTDGLAGLILSSKVNVLPLWSLTVILLLFLIFKIVSASSSLFNKPDSLWCRFWILRLLLMENGSIFLEKLYQNHLYFG